MTASTNGDPDILDPRTLDDDLLKVLSVLLRAKHSGQVPWLSAPQISKILRQDFGIPIHWITIQTLLKKDKRIADRRRRHGRWEFAIMQNGEELLKPTSEPIILVDPEKAIQAVISLHSFLGKLKGTIKICDPYLDSTSIEHLDACQPKATIQFLSKNIKDSGTLRRMISAAITQGRALEVRIASSVPLHDRYIIDDDAMLILGTSLNGFGKKQSFIIKAGPDIRGLVISVFDTIWARANLWP